MKKFLITGLAMIAINCGNIAIATTTFFDFFGCDFAVRNSRSVGVASMSISPAGFYFDASLNYSVYTPPTFHLLAAGAASGYNQPNAIGGAKGGSITWYEGVMPCARWVIGINGLYVTIDLIDANYGLGDQLHKILIDYVDTGFDVYIETDPVGHISTQAFHRNSGDEILYWDAIRHTPYPNSDYVRDRTGHANTYFTLNANEVPLAGNLVSDVTLDVNVNVSQSFTVPLNKKLRIEGDPIYSPFNTTLKFASGTGMNVYGWLYTNNARHAGGNPNSWGETNFLPSTYPNSSPGDWQGVSVRSNFQTVKIWLNHTNILYADTGLAVYDCGNNITTYSVSVLFGLHTGVFLRSTNGIHRHLFSSNNNDNGVHILYGQPKFYDCTVSHSGLNGFVWDEISNPEIHKSYIAYNGWHGALLLIGSHGLIDSSRIHDNGSGMFSGGDGIHALSNDWWLTVRYNYIYDNNNYGIYNMNGFVRAFDYAGMYPPPPMDPMNPDSIGANCIYNNYYNLGGWLGYFIMAQAFMDNAMPPLPHYQGNWNDITSPRSGFQGFFDYGTTAYLENNYFDPIPPAFLVQNSTVSTLAETYTPNPYCGSEGAQGRSVSENVDPSIQLFSQWQGLMLTPSVLRQQIASNLQRLTSAQISMAFLLINMSSTPQDAISFYSSLLSGNPGMPLRAFAANYLAKVYLHDLDWSNALTVYSDLLPYLPRSGSSIYTNTHASAACLQYYLGNRAEAQARLDSLLTAFPQDAELLTVWSVVGGNSGHPKSNDFKQVIPGFALDDAYPNPFNPSTTIRFTIPESQNVRLVVTNSLGEIVATLADKTFPEGSHSVVFEAFSLPSGVYLYTITAGDFNQTKKMVLTK